MHKMGEAFVELNHSLRNNFVMINDKIKGFKDASGRGVHMENLGKILRVLEKAKVDKMVK